MIQAVRDQIFTVVDLVLTPTAFIVAPALDDVIAQTGFFTSLCTQYWDVTGHPVASVPIGFNAAGLPLAMQLAGRPFDEAGVLRAADAFQLDTRWHLAVPDIAV